MLIRELIFFKFLDVCHIEGCRHGLSIGGQPIQYIAVVEIKNSGIPPEFLESKGFFA